MDVEEPWKWHASFSLRLLHCSKKKRVDKGFILLQAKVKRAILLGTDETLLDTYYLKEEESIHIGSVLEFPCHKVDVGEPIERVIDNENEKPPSKRNGKRKRLKKKAQPLRSPEAALLRSSIGLFARVASSRKGMSPQAKRRKSDSPSIPNVTAHFPSPNFPQRRRPRKLRMSPQAKHAAHVLNLIVQDGLFVMKVYIDKIRDSVKYIKSSQTREELFEGIVKQLGIISEKEPSIDVATRWNSTYLMIDSALPYIEAFDELAKQDQQFKYAPSPNDWKMAEAIRSLLKIFFEATNVVSGSSYPTSNRYFHEIWSVKLLLQRHAKNKNKVIASMVSKMQPKFDKYWKESYLANCIPVILDPRYKLEFIVFRIKQAFGDNAGEHLQKVDIVIKSLFKEYSHEMGDSLSDPLEEEFHVDEVEEDDNPLADWEAHLRVQKKQAASELDRYLSEELFPRKKDFDILGWWEMNSPKYPVLSRIARDVLAIQASTVASESSFSAGGRIISDHRTRLKSDTVEGLICLQDWLKAADPKSSNKDVEKEEYLVFHQASKCQEENQARSRTRRLSSPGLDPALSDTPSPSTSTTRDPSYNQLS